MDGPRPKTTRGVPWADHNSTPAQPEDPRRDEYEGADANRRNEHPRDRNRNRRDERPGERDDSE